MKKNTKKAFQLAMATTIAASALVVAVPTQAATINFADVSKDSVHYADIVSLAQQGVIQGDGKNFNPKQELRRDHAAKIIAKALGLDTTKVTDPGFTDVAADSEFYGYIAALKTAGIINGVSETKFDPSATLTRGQMAKIVAIAFELKAGENTKSFSDVKGNYFENYINALLANDVTKGFTATTYAPAKAVTREQMASFVMRGVRAALPANFDEVKTGVITNVIGKVASPVETVAVEAKAETKEVAVTLGKTATKADLNSILDSAIDSVKGTGVTGVVNSVEINGVLYNTTTSASELASIAQNVATSLNISATAAASILAAKDGDSILEFLSVGEYAGKIFLNYKDGSRDEISIKVVVPAL